MGTKVFARDELVELGLPDECEGGRVFFLYVKQSPIYQSGFVIISLLYLL
jgi:hypothetical protein